MEKTAFEKQDLFFKVIDSPEDLDKVFSLRFEVFCEELQVFTKDDYPDKRETDSYDSNSIHTVILHKKDIVAYTRLVLPTSKFPIEESAHLPPVFNRLKSVETSRALVVKAWRHSNVIWLLFNSIYSLCQEKGFESILSFSSSIMYNGFRKRGVPFLYVGETILFHGYKSYPSIMKVEKNITPNFY